MVRKDFILNAVEKMVCKAVNDAMDISYPRIFTRARHEDLYKGVTNIPVAWRLARAITFCVLHDRFGMSYDAIAFRSGLSRRKVIVNVGKIRKAPVNDKFINNLVTDVEARLTKEIF